MGMGSIIKPGAGNEIIVEYEPKEFPVEISKTAYSFVSLQNKDSNDFEISEFSSKKSGVARLKEKDIEAKIEEKAFEHLKEVEEKAYAEAYELGKIDGQEAGFEEKRKELEEQLGILYQMLEMFETMKARLVGENEITLVKLINFISTRVAMKEIEVDPSIIMSVIAQVVGELQSVDDIVIRVSPKDFEFLENVEDKLDKKAEFLKKVKLEASAEISPGGCIVETKFGLVDATLEQRLQKAWESLEARLPRLTAELKDEEPSLRLVANDEAAESPVNSQDEISENKDGNSDPNESDEDETGS